MVTLKKYGALLMMVVLLMALKSDEFVLLKTIPVKADFITTDNLGNCYAVKGNILEKYDSKGNLLKTYSNKSYGKIAFVDATNPLKILVFYNNFLQLVFLDNMLADQGEPVSIEKLGYPQTILACSSHNDGFWIYNQQNMELLRFNQNFQLTQQTGNITQLTGIKVLPNFLIEYNNKVYLNNPTIGIMVFDVFGTYSKTIPLTRLNKFQIKEDDIYYNKNEILLNKFNTYTLNETSINLPDSSVITRIEKNELYLQQPNGVGIYIIKE